jgi:UDP:flavonoid glycosyltransferase YjiC (YdhE family)
MIFLNYITPNEPKSLEKEDINLHNFLNIYKKNVYVSQGTIFKNFDFNIIIKVFEELSDVGFVLSIKKEVLDKYEFPKNVHLKQWVNQNDLLGDKRINAFVSHGGINSIVEAIYHKKPTIALGVSIDQVNTASMVKKRETGISFFSQRDIIAENLIPSIKTLLEEDNKYLKNTERMSKILNMNKPATEEFSYWLEYGFNFGFEHLIIKAYSHYDSYQFYNIDIIFIFVSIFILIIWFIKKIFIMLFTFLFKYLYHADDNSNNVKF